MNDDNPAKIISRRHLPETEKFTIQQLIILLILLIYVILTAVYQINQSVYNLWLREKSLSSMSWEEETWYLVWLTKKDLLLLLLNRIIYVIWGGQTDRPLWSLQLYIGIYHDSSYDSIPNFCTSHSIHGWYSVDYWVWVFVEKNLHDKEQKWQPYILCIYYQPSTQFLSEKIEITST